MRYIPLLLMLATFISCTEEKKGKLFTSVSVEIVYEDSLSIRAIEPMGASLAFAANRGVFGNMELETGKVRAGVQKYDSIVPEFRAVGHTSTDFFMLSVGSPALLYKTGGNGKMELVYTEEGEGVFYDAMTFWNDQEGLAIGDSVNGCLSIVITRDGGNTWDKLSCDDLPEGIEGEGAFAASNTNIETIGDQTWIGTTESRIYYSPDKGKTWQIQKTPVVAKEATQGIYSIDFYNGEIGFAIGGDYTKPNVNVANKAITKDGGKTWNLVADGMDPAYTSCVQFVPDSNGNGLVAIGVTGIFYSRDMGNTWIKLSEEPFHTLRFVNDTMAYAAGQDRIARLSFR